MTEDEAVAAVINALNTTGISYMIVGALSSNAYGIERSTKDADFVVQLTTNSIASLLKHLPKDFRLDPQIGFETVSSTTRYRMYYEPLRYLIEFFEVSEEAHDKLRFENRLPTTYGGHKAYLPRPEDVVITKLRWSLGGKSRQKDIEDVRNVLVVQQGNLDLAYIRHWCDQHGTREILERLLAEIPAI